MIYDYKIYRFPDEFAELLEQLQHRFTFVTVLSNFTYQLIKLE